MAARTLRVAGLTIGIESDDPAWLDGVVSPVLGTFLLPHNPPADARVRVRRAPPTVELEGRSPIRASGDVGLAHALEELVWRALVDHTSDKLVLHAAGLARNGRALLLPAASNAGKSTLALAMLARGCDVLSDDIVPVELATWRAVPVPRLLHLRPPTLALLADALGCVRTVSLPWVDAAERPVALAAARAATDPAARPPVAAIVFPFRASGGERTPIPLRRSLAMLELLEHTLNRGTLGAAAFHAALDLAGRVPCYRLAVGDARAAADALIALLG